VTHWLCTHRLHNLNMAGDAARHPHTIWPRHPPHSRGAEDQSGRGCGSVWVAPDVLQRDRAGRPERIAGEHREDWERAENIALTTFREGLIALTRAEIKRVTSRMRSKRNVLLDDGEHHHAFAQAIGALCFPGGRTDTTFVPCPAVSAGPTDHAAEMHWVIIRWKNQTGSCKRRFHKLLSHV